MTTTPLLTDERLDYLFANVVPFRALTEAEASDVARVIRDYAELRRRLGEAGEAPAGKYCNRYMDDAPSVRADCADWLARPMPCVMCPRRDVQTEVQDLRAQLRALRGLVRT